MTSTNVGAVVVSDQKDPVGIFTEKDFVTKVCLPEYFCSFYFCDFTLRIDCCEGAECFRCYNERCHDLRHLYWLSQDEVISLQPLLYFIWDFNILLIFSLFDAMSMLGDHGIRHLPIAEFVGSADDNDTRIVDIVSARDFFSWIKNFWWVWSFEDGRRRDFLLSSTPFSLQ